MTCVSFVIVDTKEKIERYKFRTYNRSKEIIFNHGKSKRFISTFCNYLQPPVPIQVVQKTKTMMHKYQHLSFFINCAPLLIIFSFSFNNIFIVSIIFGARDRYIKTEKRKKQTSSCAKQQQNQNISQTKM